MVLVGYFFCGESGGSAGKIWKSGGKSDWDDLINISKRIICFCIYTTSDKIIYK